MKADHEVRFKLTPDEYLFFKNYSKFLYDNRVIPTPSVHSLAKLAIRKFGNDWIEVENKALQKRKERQKVTYSHCG
jgi:hypothetical protein